jgi:ABC-type Fe3+-siderophore transport system permease subunit
MDELELLKKDWETSSKNYPELDKKTLYKLINKRSSSLVKWIFIISLLEFVFWTLISLVTNDAESLEKLKSYNVDYIIYPLTVFGYLVLGYFFYVFYKNYKNISTTEDTKLLMERILKTRKTVRHYVIFNLVFMCISIVIGVYIEITNNPEVQTLINGIEADGAKNVTIFYLIVVGISILAMVLITAVLLGFYYLIYGLLLKRLKANYKDLKELVTEQ